MASSHPKFVIAEIYVSTEKTGADFGKAGNANYLRYRCLRFKIFSRLTPFRSKQSVLNWVLRCVKIRSLQNACSPDLPGRVVKGDWRWGRGSLLRSLSKEPDCNSLCYYTRSLNSLTTTHPPTYLTTVKQLFIFNCLLLHARVPTLGFFSRDLGFF